MELHDRSQAGVKILALEGSFDTYTAEPIRRWLDESTRSAPAQVVINLSNVEFMDSTALSTLVQGMKRAREKGGELYLCGLQSPVRLIFELTRLDRVFEIYVTEEDAVQAIAG